MAGDGDVLRALAGGAWARKLNWPPQGPPTTNWDGVQEVVNGRVTKLWLYSKGLTGSIPPELGQLQNLTELWLSDNQLSGEIGTELGNLTNLVKLDLSCSAFRKGLLTGSIPPQLGQLQKLEHLVLSNNQLTDVIPRQLGELHSLKHLNLGGNQLKESIPKELGQLRSLTSLELWGNQLTGSIPKELGNLTHLTQLYLSSNKLEGIIPKELGQLQKLEGLDLSDSKLTGNIPSELGSLTDLKYLQIGSNNLTGEIPSSVTKLKQLKAFGLAQNELEGNIPAELGECSKLAYLDLSENQLSGGLPASLRHCRDLECIWLNNNKLTDFDEITSKMLLEDLGYPKLRDVRLYKNEFDISQYEKFAMKLLDKPEQGRVRKRFSDDEVSWFAVQAAKEERFSAAVQILQLKPSSALSAIKTLSSEFIEVECFDKTRRHIMRDKEEDKQNFKEEEDQYEKATKKLLRAASFMVWHAPSGEFMSEALQQDKQGSDGDAKSSDDILLEWLKSVGASQAGPQEGKEIFDYEKQFLKATKDKKNKDEMQKRFMDEVTLEMAKSDAMLALVEEDKSFGIWSIFVLQCVFLWRHLHEVKTTWASMRRTRELIELVLLVFTPFAILCIQLAFPVLILYNEIDYLMLSGLDSSGYTNLGSQNVYFCPNANVHADEIDFGYSGFEGFHGSPSLQRAAATLVAILYFSRYFMVARAKLSPPRARTEAEIMIGRKMEFSYMGSWRMGMVDDLMDVVHEGTVYAINLRVALTGTSLINILLNSLALEFVMTLDNDWKESYGKVYGNEVKAYLKRMGYLDRYGFKDRSKPTLATGSKAAAEGVSVGASPKNCSEAEEGDSGAEAKAGDAEKPDQLTPETPEEKRRDCVHKYVWYFNSGYVVLLELYFLLAVFWLPLCDVTIV